MGPRVSVFALTFGNHLHLLRRCLGPILDSADPAVVADVRVLTADASPDVTAYVRAAGPSARVPVYLVQTDENPGKYLVMREAFRPKSLPPVAGVTMWFDDDSHLTEPSASWWAEAAAVVARADYVGKPYRITLHPNQEAAIRDQPWYTGRPLAQPHTGWFFTGGWWAAKTSLLAKWDYPFPELHHNGGDVMLGQLAFQQRWSWAPWHKGVAVNDAPRRGLDTVPLWYDYTPGARTRHFPAPCRESVVRGPGAEARST